MRLIRSQSESLKTTLVIDIGSSRVMCAYVRHARDLKPCILATTRSTLPRGALFAASSYRQEVLKALRVALGSMAGKHPGVVANVVVTLSSLLYVSQIRQVRAQNLFRQVITKKLLDQYVLAEVEHFRRTARDTVLLDTQLVSVKINGYQSQHPIAKRANSLELSLYISFVDAEMQNALKTCISEALHRETLEFHSFALAASTALKEKVPLTSELLIIVGGELTEIVQLDGGNLKAIVTLPFGKNRLIRELQTQLKVSSHEATSLLSMFEGSKLTDALHFKIGSILGTLAETWKQLLDEALLRNEPLRRPGVFVVSEPSSQPFFVRALQAWTSEGSPLAPSAIVPLTSDLMLPWCDHVLVTERDNFLMLAALFSATLK